MTRKILVSSLLAGVIGAMSTASLAQAARDSITIVGSSTVYPFTTTVAEPTAVDVENAFLNSGRAGVGTLTGTVKATTLGTPALNGLLASTLWGGGAGKSSFAGKASVSGAIGGRLSFTENGQTHTGFIVKGKGKVGGAPLTIFNDGNDPPVCGDGIVQPGIGEEGDYD